MKYYYEKNISKGGQDVKLAGYIRHDRHELTRLDRQRYPAQGVDHHFTHGIGLGDVVENDHKMILDTGYWMLDT